MPDHNHFPLAILLAGVCGSGKTTIGIALAARLGIHFLDADDFHPAANIAKMSAGIPLDDHDREPWLEAIAQRMCRTDSFVLACSALKESYRAKLLQARGDLKMFHLTAPPQILETRLRGRSTHFMPATLLASQLEALEIPRSARIIDTSQSLKRCLDQILDQFQN